MARRGASSGNIYASAFQNGQSAMGAIAKMRQDRAAAALREAQQQAMQQRYLATQAQAAERQQYQRGRDTLHDRMSGDKFAYQKQKDAAALSARMKAAANPQPTAAERNKQLGDVSANRYLNEANPPAAIPLGFNGNRSPEAVKIATDAREKYFTDHPDETPGPAQPFASGVAGFNKMTSQRQSAEKDLAAADTNYGVVGESEFPGMTRAALGSFGSNIPFTRNTHFRDPASGSNMEAPVGKDKLPLIGIPSGQGQTYFGSPQGQGKLIAALAKMQAMKQTEAALPQGYPASLPQPISEHYPQAERPMMMPNAAPPSAPPAGQRAPYAEPPLPTKAPVEAAEPELIPIINPSGQRGRIPKANVDSALAAGWSLPEE